MSEETSDGTSEYTILCGICETPVSHRVEGDPNSQVGCAACNNWADHDQVIETVKEYVTEQAQLSLNRRMRDIARGSKMLSFSGDTESKKTYAFIADVDF